jgi:hypothetical protein
MPSKRQVGAALATTNSIALMIVMLRVYVYRTEFEEKILLSEGVTIMLNIGSIYGY